MNRAVSNLLYFILRRLHRICDFVTKIYCALYNSHTRLPIILVINYITFIVVSSVC